MICTKSKSQSNWVFMGCFGEMSQDSLKWNLIELELLVDTYGIETLRKIPCFVRKFDASTYISSGKLEEFALLAEELKADVVIFDDEISPAQQRNLEKAFKRPVIDRTEVILGVFAQRAQTKEAHLQIDLEPIVK